MAIYSAVPPPSQQAPAGIDIEAWNVSALQSLSIAPKIAAGVTLAIALDNAEEEGVKARAEKTRKEPLKRDSLKRRDALLKGKEGSRRRQRWNNGELLLYIPRLPDQQFVQLCL
jgi:hypothetical protein